MDSTRLTTAIQAVGGASSSGWFATLRAADTSRSTATTSRSAPSTRLVPGWPSSVAGSRTRNSSANSGEADDRHAADPGARARDAARNAQHQDRDRDLPRHHGGDQRDRDQRRPELGHRCGKPTFGRASGEGRDRGPVGEPEALPPGSTSGSFHASGTSLTSVSRLGAPHAPRSGRTSRARRESCPRTSLGRRSTTRSPGSPRPSRTSA